MPAMSVSAATVKVDFDSFAVGGLDTFGEAILEAAQEGAPVDTGALRESLRMESEGHDAAPTVVAIGSDLDYSVYQEMGTYKMKAQPYLRPAIAAGVDAAEGIFSGNTSKSGDSTDNAAGVASEDVSDGTSETAGGGLQQIIEAAVGGTGGGE